MLTVPKGSSNSLLPKKIGDQKMSTSLRRKLAIATWSAPEEGNIYGKLSLDATHILAYIDYLRKKGDQKVSLTHIVGKATGLALAKCPTLNGRIVWGAFHPHKSVDLAFLVATDDGKNLAKVKIEHIDQKTVTDICTELNTHAQRLREGQDEAFNKSQGPLKILPSWLIRPLVKLTGWLTGALGVNMKALGLEAFPFGGGIITNVGMFGLDEGFVPPTPFARVPLYVLIGALRDTPVVIDGEITIRPMLTLTSTMDHRFIDGFQVAMLAKTIRACFAEPWTIDGENTCPW
jgi:pyruvate/2-oxoglutarate dehydrogenase complex dihydrolipoamide acyltransferase (E2) component